MARPRKFDEKKVLDAAKEQFWDGGYSATSLDELTSATGLGKGSLYGAFGDKHQLFLRALDEYRVEQMDGVRAVLRGDGRAWDRLVAILEGSAALAGSELGRRGCMLANSTSELNLRDESVVARARESYGGVEDLLTECVTEAQRQGDIAADADPRALGRLIVTILQGLDFMGKTGMATDALRQVAETAIATLPR
jgi:AcrR family transcriptional regulator